MMPQERYYKLKDYLSAENPVLLDVIDQYQELDEVAHKIGFLTPKDTFTTNISWWPMISILGTFSAGKSTFINNYIGKAIQQSGNQAVDDKFTVVCYGENEEPVTLPGLALDADPRFPFYNISEEVNKVDEGEGDRVNMYLQLKTLKSPSVKGKTIIDSPGFDADSQRDGILKITSHIVDMSDLVLIFFDARHPEPGAMRDTLTHLVGETLKHRDANKVLYVLNQIDTTAQEDNLETVISSWQRALSQEGLISGDFYSIYDEDSANIINDVEISKRLKQKKDNDLSKIIERMDKVSIERAYRIIKSLDSFSKDLKEKKIPTLQKALKSWSNKVFWTDIVILVLVMASFIGLNIEFNLIDKITSSKIMMMIAGGLSLAGFFAFHFKIRSFFAYLESKKYEEDDKLISNAILNNTKWWIPMFVAKSNRWTNRSVDKLDGIMSQVKLFIQKLNDQFISPSGVDTNK